MAEPWQPLLSGADAARALDLVREIAGDPTDPLPSGDTRDDADDDGQPQTASVAGGHAGLAVFRAHVARAIGSESTDRLAYHLDASDDALAEVAMPSTLFDGFTGIGWANAHIERLIADEAADLDEIDAIVLEQLSEGWDGNYELVNGVTGMGVYALERLPSGKADRMVALTIEQLRTMAIAEGPMLTWFTPPAHLAVSNRGGFPSGHVNLGVAHGVPGVVAFLGAACLAGHAATARPLLEGVVPWLLAQQLGASSPGVYPNWIAPGVERRAARLAWCYGDAGIASALLLAARGAGRDDWQTAALAIARRAAARTLETSGVQDAMLCHGAAGVAHLFNRMFQATGEAWLAEAARRWFAQVFQMRRPGAGIAGYHSLTGDEEAGPSGWQTDPGLLTGTAGLALALLAAATEIEPEWDRLLLISARHLPR